MNACIYCGDRSGHCANDCRPTIDERFEPMTHMTRGIANVLAYALATNQDGFTISRDALIPADGIFVGNPDTVRKYATRATGPIAFIEQWIVDNRDREYFGIWSEDGVTYLDASDRFAPNAYGMRDAMVACAARGEICAYDAESGVCIYTPENLTDGKIYVAYRRNVDGKRWQAWPYPSMARARKAANMYAMCRADNVRTYDIVGFAELSRITEPSIIRALMGRLADGPITESTRNACHRCGGTDGVGAGGRVCVACFAENVR